MAKPRKPRTPKPATSPRTMPVGNRPGGLPSNTEGAEFKITPGQVGPFIAGAAQAGQRLGFPRAPGEAPDTLRAEGITTSPPELGTPELRENPRPRRRTRGVGASIAAATGTASGSGRADARAALTGVEAKAVVGNVTVQTTSTARKRSRSRAKAGTVRNNAQLQFQTVVLITALEQALEYKPRKQGNSQPPELYSELELDKPVNRKDVAELVAELRRLNDALEKARAPVKKSSLMAPGSMLRKVVERFAMTTATGAAVLVVGVAATWLQQAGLYDPSVIPMPKLR